MKVKGDLTAKGAKGTKEILRAMPSTSRFSFSRRIPRDLTIRHVACAMNQISAASMDMIRMRPSAGTW
jgi:hypothetical protein